MRVSTGQGQAPEATTGQTPVMEAPTTSRPDLNQRNAVKYPTQTYGIVDPMTMRQKWSGDQNWASVHRHGIEGW